ncbi:hypothetical protein LPB67_06830 [Undibacterium sp. Jales W-56]|uniref:PilX N-terminal domain-containing pilus assembly protein n=1 Tax=Undibacterium sp. Jales W-56 TaxID=2897325 RepID=UPI0021D34A21|nr:PilX N-terminal domain-containing pilus assembly protein [Undibacterium sp. Jales W-56]MCU6433495.1 hypothetical protein [Undibacterium sp. Jales W-56]
MILTPSQQRGATLLVSLIMLILITILVVTAFKLSKGNLQIAGNMQQRNQLQVAAQSTIEEIISTTRFTDTPTNALLSPCNAVLNTKCFDVTGKGGKDVTVAVTLTCTSVKPVLNANLDISKTDDQGCTVGVRDDLLGVEGGPGSSDVSFCAERMWDIQAAATDNFTSAQYTVNQGTAIRVPVTTTCP